MNLSSIQQKNIKSAVYETIDKLNGIENKEFSKSKDEFLAKIEKNYNKKSYNQFTYFLKHISTGYNQRTGEQYIKGLYDNYNNYKYSKNLYLDSNEKVKIQELKPALFANYKDYQYANKKVAKALYIEHKCKKLNRVFITLTLPSKYHYYTNKGKTKNKKFGFKNYEESLELGLKKLNKINRTLHQKINLQTKRFYEKKGLNYKPYHFIKILEYHKSLSPHLHMIIYCNEEQLSIIKKQYENIIEKFELNKKNNKCDVIHSKKASSYVYKYLLKNANQEKDDNSLFNKYKSYFSKVRIFSSSNFEYASQAQIDKIYSFLLKNRPKLFKQLKKSNIPLYVHLENMIRRNDFRFEYEEKSQTIVDKKKLEDLAKNLYEKNSYKNYEVYSKILNKKTIYTKVSKIKTIAKIYYFDKYTQKENLIYDKNDFNSYKKVDFNNEFFGDYVLEPEEHPN